MLIRLRTVAPSARMNPDRTEPRISVPSLSIRPSVARRRAAGGRRRVRHSKKMTNDESALLCFTTDSVCMHHSPSDGSLDGTRRSVGRTDDAFVVRVRVRVCRSIHQTRGTTRRGARSFGAAAAANRTSRRRTNARRASYPGDPGVEESDPVGGVHSPAPKGNPPAPPRTAVGVLHAVSSSSSPCASSSSPPRVPSPRSSPSSSARTRTPSFQSRRSSSSSSFFVHIFVASSILLHRLSCLCRSEHCEFVAMNVSIHPTIESVRRGCRGRAPPTHVYVEIVSTINISFDVDVRVARSSTM